MQGEMKAKRYRETLYYRIPMYSISIFFFSSRRRHTRFDCDWSSDVCSSDLQPQGARSCTSAMAGQIMRLAIRAYSAVSNRKFNSGVEGSVQPAAREVSLPYEIGRASCRERV